MRVSLCVKKDLFGLIAVREFMSAIKGHDIEISTFCSVKTRPAEDTSPWLGLFKLLERQVPFDFIAPLLEGQGVLGADHDLAWPWQPITGLRDEARAGPLLEARPDLIVSMRFSLIFPEWIINSIPYGIINVHPGPLPNYRGLFAPFWQMVSGEETFASTVHFIDKGIDTGPIIASHIIPRQDAHSLMWHIAELYRGGARLAADAVLRTHRQAARIDAAIQPVPGVYYKFPSDEELKAASTGLLKFVDTEDYGALMREAFALPAYSGNLPAWPVS